MASASGCAGASYPCVFEQERQDSLWATSDGGRHWGEVAGTGLPWEGSSYSDMSIKGCGSPDPFNVTAVSAAWCSSRKLVARWTARALAERRRGPTTGTCPPAGTARWVGGSAEGWHYPGAGKAGPKCSPFGSSQTARTCLLLPPVQGSLWSTARPVPAAPGHWRRCCRPARWAAGRLLGVLPERMGAAGAGRSLCDDRRWRALAAGAFGVEPPGYDGGQLRVPGQWARVREFPEVGLPSTGDVGMRTADGGLSWEAVQFSAPAFVGNFTTEVPFATVDFANAEDGWVGGTDGVDATTDAGSAWSQQLATGEPVQELSFSDATQGWALTADELLATSDGGHVWSCGTRDPPRRLQLRPIG